MWKYIKTIIFSKADQNIFNILKNIQKFKAQVKGLIELVKDITKQPVTPILYIDALRSKDSPPANGKPNGQCIQAIPAYRAREPVVVLRTEIVT